MGKEVIKDQDYRTLVETAPDAAVVTDIKGRVTFASKRAYVLLGERVADDMVGKSVFDWIAPEAHERVRSRFVEIVTGQSPPETREYDLVKGDGSRIFGEVTSSVLEDFAGHPTGLLLSCRDITERKKMMQSLRASEERFRSVWSSSSDGMRLTDRDGRIVDANEAYCAMVKIPKEKLIGQIFSVTYKSHGPEDSLSLYRRRFDSGEVVPFAALPATLWTGEKLNLEISNSLITTADQGKLFLCIFRDVTQRVRAEKALQTAKEFAENIIQTANVIFLQLDVQGNIQKLNAAAEELTGYSAAEIEGKNWFDTVVPEHRYPHVREEFVRSSATGTFPTVFENPVLTKDGKERQILWKNSVLREGDQVVGSISFGLDITERKQWEIRTARDLEEKESLLRELQHRVKNNLNIISSLLNLEIPKIPDERSREIFLDAQGRIRSMAKIYERLYSSASLASVDLHTYIHDLAQSLFNTYHISGKRIVLSTDLAEMELEMRRAVPLGLILNELITNALKYAFPGERQGNITISLKNTDGKVHLCLADDGIGLPTGFDPDAVQSIGLKLVKLLTEQIDGSVRIARDHGTRVCVTFTL